MPDDNELERLRLADERLQAFLRYASEGIFMFEGPTPMPVTLPVEEQVDRMLHEGVLGECNEQMARMYGASAGELIGRRVIEFLGHTPGNREYLAAFVRSGYQIRDAESEEADQQGVMHVFSNSMTGVVENGCLVRVWGTQVDVTARKHVERELRDARDRLELALDASGVGIWEYHPLSGRIIWDHRCRALFGIMSDRDVSYSVFLQGLHPEDRPGAEAAVARVLEGKAGDRLDLEHRTLGIDDGLVRWVSVRGRAFFDLSGRATRLIGTLRDVTTRHDERLRLEHLVRENERLLAEAERALSIRDDFLSIASHELRTPLTALHMRLHRVEPGKPVDEGLLRFLHRQVSRLTRLVRELVDVTRIESGRLELHPTRADLVQIARDAIDEVADDARRTDTDIRFQAPDRVDVTVDPDYVAQAIENLLSNGIKYGRGRPVELSIGSRGGAAEVSVHDDGIGISAEEQERIFQRFVRAVPARAYGGLGLGLYIVRRIAEAHGGAIEVESEPGHGTTFRLRLPAGGDGAAAAV